VPVSTSSTASSLASALASLITADTDSAVEASATDGVVTLTARHAGTEGNTIDVRHSHAWDEALPSGVGVYIVEMADGAGAIDLAEVIAQIPGDVQYHVMACGFTDSNALGLLKTELADRGNAENKIGSLAFIGATGTASAATTLGNAHNSEWLSIVHVPKSPTPPWAIAAATAATVGKAAAIDPARPFQTLPLVGVVAPRLTDRLTRQERNTLLTDGIATTKTTQSGEVLLERVTTTYQTSPAGVPDTAYLDATTIFTLDVMRYEFATMVATKYARHKLALDGTRFGAGQAVVTPSVMRGECVALGRSWEERGMLQSLADFKRDLLVQINSSDPARLDIYMPPHLVSGLRVVAAQVGFRL
jgi:phage tail sheath gpL-like